MKAYHIDSRARTIEAVEYAGLADMQRMVGGYIEAAVSWPNGDVLFVDSDGMLKGNAPFFRIEDRPDQPLAGNAIVVGPEIGDSPQTRPPSIWGSHDGVVLWAPILTGEAEWIEESGVMNTHDEMRAKMSAAGLPVHPLTELALRR